MESIGKTEPKVVTGDPPAHARSERAEIERPKPHQSKEATEPVVSEVSPRLDSYERAYDMARSLGAQIPRNEGQALQAQANQSVSIVRALMS